MEHEGPLSCSQEPLHWSLSLARWIQSIAPDYIYLRSILILSITYVEVFLLVFFLRAFPPKTCLHSISPCYVLNTLPMSSSLTWSFCLYLAKSTSYKAPNYAVFSDLLIFHLSWVQIFFKYAQKECASYWVTWDVFRTVSDMGRKGPKTPWQLCFVQLFLCTE
jgi:hypothetical protein